MLNKNLNGADFDLDIHERGGLIPSLWVAQKDKNDAYLQAKEESYAEPIFNTGEDKDIIHFKENYKRQNKPEIIDWLVKNNVSIPSDICRLTWFEYAIYINLPSFVKFLININENLYETSSFEWNTLIEYASMYGNLDMIKLLLENGFNKEVFLNDNSLIFAANNDFPEVIEYLINLGKDVNKPQLFKGNYVKGYTALRQAAQVNSLESAKLLCKLGADVNVEGSDTPLYSASAEGYLEMVKLLIKNGANVNYKNQFGTTPYKIAISFKHSEISEYLLSCGAKK